MRFGNTPADGHTPAVRCTSGMLACGEAISVPADYRAFRTHGSAGYRFPDTPDVGATSVRRIEALTPKLSPDTGPSRAPCGTEGPELPTAERCVCSSEPRAVDRSGRFLQHNHVAARRR